MRLRRAGNAIWTAALTVLAVVSIMALAAGRSQAQDPKPLKGVALIIGNGAYAQISVLRNPANDARAIENLLAGLGFQTTLVSDRDARRLRRDLDIFAEDAEGADVAVVYYAGHGIEAGGENFLVPVDADLSALQAAGEALVPVSGFIERLRMTVPVSIVMLDACRDNPFPPDSMVRLDASSAPVPIGQSGLGETRGAARLTEPEAGVESIGSVIGFAAAPGKAALDGTPGGNSYYAAAILRHLDAMAAGEEFGVVMRMVAEEVYLKTSGRQVPWINESLRRLLYFGKPPEAARGEEGELLAERRQLLLTIADLPDPELRRRQAEQVAADGGVPLDAVYGMLRAMGANTPENPAELEKVLRAEAERFARVLAEREVIESPDPEIIRLTGLADRAEQEGLLATADSFRDRAKARFLEIEVTLEDQQDEIDQRFIEGAAVFVRSAETKALVFDHLSAAQDYAEAFRRVEKRDSWLAWRYKLAESVALADHGIYKGDNAALERAIDAGRQALNLVSRETVPLDWAQTQNSIGIALSNLGSRESGVERLAEAVAVFRMALEERTRERVPLDWAKTQNGLGGVLRTLGSRESGTARLEEAVTAYRASLEEVTRERAPLDWAAAQNNLGNVLWTLGSRERGTTRLEEAVAAYRAALEEMTRERVPLHWAAAQNNLGLALQAIGFRDSGTERLAEAAAAYRAALEEWTRERVPLDWAAGQNNLGGTLRIIGERENSTARLEEAVAAYRSALEERTRERVPLDWAATQNNLGSALQGLGSRESGTARLEEAVVAYRAALEERTRGRVPLQWAATQVGLGGALQGLGAREGGTARLKEAVEAYRAALDELTRERAPLDWAMTQGNLGAALRSLGEREGGTARLEEAVVSFRAALEENTRERALLEWTRIQNNLGLTLRLLGERAGRRDIVEEGRAAIAAAWEGYSEAGYGQYDNHFRKLLAETDALLARMD